MYFILLYGREIYLSLVMLLFVYTLYLLRKVEYYEHELKDVEAIISETNKISIQYLKEERTE